MHSRATIAALVFAVSACAGSNEENRPAQAVGESHNTPQTSAGTPWLASPIAPLPTSFDPSCDHAPPLRE